MFSALTMLNMILNMKMISRQLLLPFPLPLIFQILLKPSGVLCLFKQKTHRKLFLPRSTNALDVLKSLLFSLILILSHPCFQQNCGIQKFISCLFWRKDCRCRSVLRGFVILYLRMLECRLHSLFILPLVRQNFTCYFLAELLVTFVAQLLMSNVMRSLFLTFGSKNHLGGASTG